MTPSSSSPSTSKSPPSTPPPPLKVPHFTPIQEEAEDEQSIVTPSVESITPKHYPPNPICRKDKKGKPNSKKRPEFDVSVDGDNGSVSCSNCRPHAREKISVVPLDNAGLKTQASSISSPNGIFKSIISTLTRKSPKSLESPLAAKEEQWKIAVAELSQKLIKATRNRDEALSEASRLKHSMAELEKKLDKLEIYCHTLKSGIEECTYNSPHKTLKTTQSFYKMNHQNLVIEHFLVSVSEARSCVRLLSRSLSTQLKQMGAKVYERLSLLLQPYDIKVSVSKNPKSLLFYLEALLNKALLENFESIGFQKNSCNQILNPIDRCEANFTSFNLLHGLTWEEVLEKGTRHFSEDFSRFCDRKMSEIVAMLGWNRAWPEPLLQAFFCASKSVWLAHLLANSVHPGLPIFRVEKGVSFDSAYMEDMGGGGDKAMKLVPNAVRIMVAPGFYVFGSVVKCKVLCRYVSNHIDNYSHNRGKGLA